MTSDQKFHVNIVKSFIMARSLNNENNLTKLSFFKDPKYEQKYTIEYSKLILPSIT